MLSGSRVQMQASEAISSTSVRYISDNIQFSRMKYSTTFPQPSPLQLYDHYGINHEILSDHIPQQIDSKLNTYDSNLYMDPSLHNQHGVFDICSQYPIINYQSGPSTLMTIKTLDCPPIEFGANHLTTTEPTTHTYDSNIVKQQKRIPGQPREIVAVRNAKKRPFQSVNTTTKTSPETAAGNAASHIEWTKNKKMAVCFREQLQDHKVLKEIKEVQKDRVPVRRSHKLADKITALQKLVSPYGKTDTASVLHEASVFIKALQDQIENTFHRIRTTDYECPHSKIAEEKQFDPRSYGFCLVPVSLTQNLIKDNPFNPYSTTLTHF